MPRRPSVIPSSSLDVHLDAALRTRLDLLLWSESEGRVPQGSYKRFFDALIRQALDWKGLDLAAFLNTEPAECVVRGKPETIDKLREFLESATKGETTL